MGCYLRCRKCNSNLYIVNQKDELQFPVKVGCGICGYSADYGLLEVIQERHDYTCTFCKRSFFIRRTPPIYVYCPHCKSNTYISADNAITILREGTMPDIGRDAVGGLAGGAIIGSVLGPGGVILGGLLGALLGRQGLSREAIYQNGY